MGSFLYHTSLSSESFYKIGLFDCENTCFRPVSRHTVSGLGHLQTATSTGVDFAIKKGYIASTSYRFIIIF